LEDGAPDEFALQRFEEGFDHRVIVAVSLARHRNEDAMPPQFGLVLDGAVLAATIGMVDQSGGRAPDDDGSTKSRQRQLLMQPIAGRPADDAASEEIDHHHRQRR